MGKFEDEIKRIELEKEKSLREARKILILKKEKNKEKKKNG